VGVIWEREEKNKNREEREKVRGLTSRSKKTLTSDMFHSYQFSVPHHLLQVGPIVRTAVNIGKDDNQWTLQATSAIGGFSQV
jgi:hypothetical protein